jgi:hypothetical protein
MDVQAAHNVSTDNKIHVRSANEMGFVLGCIASIPERVECGFQASKYDNKAPDCQ